MQILETVHCLNNCRDPTLLLTSNKRVSRLVRKTLSFSKKLENHVGAIWNFIHEYNRLIREKRVEQEPNTIFSILY